MWRRASGAEHSQNILRRFCGEWKFLERGDRRSSVLDEKKSARKTRQKRRGQRKGERNKRKGREIDKMSWFVLIGGESLEEQGSDLSKRQFLHTSLNFIGQAYDTLRSSGVPRERIIVIAQLRDYLRSPHITEETYPYKVVQESCQRLIAEGGADYDFEQVNPGTVWCVMKGIQTKEYHKVIPHDSGSIFFGIYSHGDYHSAQPPPPTSTSQQTRSVYPAPLPPTINPYNHEWFAHMPYPISSTELAQEMLSFVSTVGATGEKFHTPERYLYATQLRSIFVHLFSNRPHRPVVGLLNFCFSGGMIEFMKQPAARDYYGANNWPLFLMSASQSNHSALVGGLWTDFFTLFANEIQTMQSSSTLTTTVTQVVDNIKLRLRKRSLFSSPDESLNDSKKENQVTQQSNSQNISLKQFFRTVCSSYFINCSYELHGHVISRVFAGFRGRVWSHFSIEIMPLLYGGEGGEPDYRGLAELQEKYRRRGIIIWHSNQWGEVEANLVDAVHEARQHIAIPNVVYGENSGICDMPVSILLTA